MVEKISKNFSMEGWEFGKFVKGNWGAVKEGIKTLAPFFFALAFFKDNPTLIVTFTLIGKGLLDLAHYYLFKKKFNG